MLHFVRNDGAARCRTSHDGVWHALLFMLAAALLWVCTGCVYKGAKVVEGTDLAIGVELPGSDGVAQLNLLNYLSGFRLAVDKNARLKVDYTVAETNTYLGVVSTATRKTIKAKVKPLAVESADAGSVAPQEEAQ